MVTVRGVSSDVAAVASTPVGRGMGLAVASSAATMRALERDGSADAGEEAGGSFCTTSQITAINATKRASVIKAEKKTKDRRLHALQSLPVTG